MMKTTAVIRRRRLLGAALLWLGLPREAHASQCFEEFNGQVTLVTVAHFTPGNRAGSIVKEKVDVLQRILAGSAFQRSSAIESHLSAYTDPHGQPQLMITLSASYSGGYDAITALFEHPDHLSIEVTQCQA
ncbi:hypothetical protein [Photobacterium sp. TY1-4]|uniref:hypothetical protein n=1 Tax=Photobacterium sp. TY1-4 TaxID=2899122 RepID=UPI0021C107AD|nr:hypothetical protein [Photobacterium sp. TY1-4]UXI01799.1 hypothetical protein NH461_02905 [Photobacterium sp. TY1-4]